MIDIVTFVGLGFASFFDFKDREIPPLLSYSLFFIGIFLNFVLNLNNQELLFQNFLISAVCIIFAYLLYYFGVWAGGDFKLFTALSVLIPQYFGIPFFPFIILFSSLLAFFPFALLFVFYKTFEKKSFRKIVAQKFWKRRFSIFRTANFVFLSAFFIQFFNVHWLAGLLVFAFLKKFEKQAKYLAIAIPLIFIYSADLMSNYFVLIALVILFDLGITSFKILRKKVLTTRINVSKLKEGMIPAKDFWIENGKIKRNQPVLFSVPRPDLIVNSKLARGLANDEIKVLKKHGVKKVMIKKSMPFIPVMFFGYICLVIYLTFLK